MKKFNDNWKFLKLNNKSDFFSFKKNLSSAVNISLPHDWLIGNVSNLYGNSKGWYQKNFYCNDNLDEYDYIIRFGGIYMDSEIYINDIKVFEWKYGYTSFEINITKHLKKGVNEVIVSANFQSPNSRWYSGAGIYRDVYMDIVPKTHIVNDSIYFHASKLQNDIWKINLNIEIINICEYLSLELSLNFKNPSNDGKHCNSTHLKFNNLDSFQEIEFYIENPYIWDIDEPNLYELKCTLLRSDEIIHSLSTFVGFRKIEIHPDKGFILNEKKVKLQGVCEHTESGALGAVYDGAFMKRRLLLLKDMGVNAIRFSHNMPDSHTLKLTDELGFLVINEAFDMWEHPKTEYDYSRFFKKWYKKDVASWIRRDRNHPSVILWSIGNEISDTNLGKNGFNICKSLLTEVDKHDPFKNAFRTMGSNYMPWEGAKKCADLLDMVGYNYGDKYYAPHHKLYSQWVIYGSETSSIASSRGVYHFPYGSSILADDDFQCSALGNSPTSWGAKSMQECLLNDVQYNFSAGQFIWSGFDYIGEPTPYHTKNSYLGQIDTAGFPKDSFYVIQSAWKDFKASPMLHIYPYWDFNDEQLIDILVASNAPLVELFLNGKSQGIRELNKESRENFIGIWQIPYENGELMAMACDEDGNEVLRTVRHSFGDAYSLNINLEYIHCDGYELIFANVYVLDREGYIVENANNYIQMDVDGGALLAMDNGDSTDLDEYITNVKRLFNGKLLGIIRPLNNSHYVTVSVYGNGLVHCSKTFDLIQHTYIDCLRKYENKFNSKLNLILPRTIKLHSSNGMHLYPENSETVIITNFYPTDTEFKDVIFDIVNDKNIPTKIAMLSTDDNITKIIAKSDGTFRLKAMSKCGGDSIRIISSLEFVISGFGIANINPFEYVSAGIYDFSCGELGNGNENGVATARDGISIIGFKNIDFTDMGSDTVTLDIFALTDDPYEFEIYRGDDISNGICIGKYIYQKPKIWNVYQKVTWKLDEKLTGLNSIFFLLKAKVHIKGFIFDRYNKVKYFLNASFVDNIYGDSYTISDGKILNIGNNVTLEFNNLDFSEYNTDSITIYGSTPIPKTGILLEINSSKDTYREMLYFENINKNKNFAIPKLDSKADIKLIFLPGSNFDFYGINFI